MDDMIVSIAKIFLIVIGIANWRKIANLAIGILKGIGMILQGIGARLMGRNR